MMGLEKLAALVGLSFVAHATLRKAQQQRLERNEPSAKRLAPLCKHCAKIPFRDIAEGTATSLPRAWVLPRFQEDCPFCRLVNHVIKNKDGPWMQPGGGVSIEWETYLAPGCRPAFRIAKRHGAWIAFGDPQRGPDTKTSEPTYLCASVESHLNVKRVSSWIDHCTTQHACITPSDNFSISFPGLEVLRLIDVRRACIVETKIRPAMYVALSYVWGDVTSSHLLLSTRTRLMKSGALERDVTLPNTIRDAIDLVDDLGIQYLWVDSLCLVQDDPADLHKGLRAMGRIYELAGLTIVAACGSDANAGLPGVGARRRRRSKVLREVRPGVHLGVIHSPDHLLKRSIYQTRAWTYVDSSLLSSCHIGMQLTDFTACKSTSSRDVYFASSVTKSSSGAENPSASRAATMLRLFRRSPTPTSPRE